MSVPLQTLSKGPVTILVLLSMLSMSVVGPPVGPEDAIPPGPMDNGHSIGKVDSVVYIDLKDEPASRIGGGQIEWSIPLSNAGGQPLSTPALSDLDLDGTLEIVVASASDQVFTLNPHGNYYWDEPYADDTIDYLGQTAGTSGLDFEPPHIFSSVISADVNLGDTPETIIGVKNGALCIGSDGAKQWKRGLTTGYYFSTACLTDLEGTYSGNKDEIEIAISSDDESNRGWLEAKEGNGRSLLREVAPTESGLVGCTIVASDLDGNPERGHYAMPPDPENELDTELVLCYPGVPLSIFMRNGTDPSGFPIYDQSIMVKDPDILVFGTSAVGNITGGPECEVIVPYCKGNGNWTNWTGGIKAYAYDGSPLWDFPLQDKGTGVCTSPAIAFMDQGKELPKKKVIVFGSDNGFVYAIDAETHSLMWQFDTTGRVLSSPAISDIGHDGELEVVIGSDSGKVFCFDLDPSDGVDEGVSYSGDGFLQDILWVNDTSAPLGISSPVIADIDLDRQLEVVIGDSNGTLYCISAGGSSLKGQKDWPEFHNDHNRTGVYRSGICFGVNIRISEDEHGKSDASIKRIGPGRFITFNLTVENTGNWKDDLFEDTIMVGIQNNSVPVNWRAWLDTPPDRGNDNPGYVKLTSKEKAALTLYVYAPWVGDIGEIARINVTATSLSEPRASDSIVLTAVLDIYPNFNIHYERPCSTDPLDPLYMKKWDQISDGDTATYEISLENLGTINDTYTLELTVPPVGNGWDWYFEDTGRLNRTVFLNSPIYKDLWGGTSRIKMVLKVHAPNNAQKENRVPIWVNATSEVHSLYYPEMNWTQGDELILILGHSDYPIPVIEPSILHIMPGETGQALMNLSNNGNKDVVRYNITLEDEGGPLGIEYPTGPISVIRGTTIGVPINIMVPMDAEIGEVHELTFFAIPPEVYWSMPDAKDSLKVIIGKEQGFSVAPSRFELEAEEGEILSLTMSIRSLWNGSDVVGPWVNSAPLNWSVAFTDLRRAALENFHISNWSNSSFKVFVTVPFGAGSGAHLLELTFSNMVEGSMDVIVPIHINIREDVFKPDRPGVTVIGLNGERSIRMDLKVDEVKDIWVQIGNTGNFSETILTTVESITGEGPGEGWNLEVISIGHEEREMRFFVEKDIRNTIIVDDLGMDEMLIPNKGSKNHIGLTLSMKANSSAWVHLRISGPSRSLRTVLHSSVWALTCNVKGYSITDTFVMSLDPLYPDLKISGNVVIQDSKGRTNLTASETVNVSLIVMNEGNTTCSDHKVIVRVDGRLMAMSVVGPLDPYDSRMVTLSFKAEKGEHRVTIEVDPDNDVIEDRDQFMEGGVNDNNVYETTIYVEGEEGLDSDIIIAIILAITVLIVTVVILLTIYLRNKERNENGAMERAEEE